MTRATSGPARSRRSRGRRCCRRSRVGAAGGHAARRGKRSASRARIIGGNLPPRHAPGERHASLGAAARVCAPAGSRSMPRTRPYRGPCASPDARPTDARLRACAAAARPRPRRVGAGSLPHARARPLGLPPRAAGRSHQRSADRAPSRGVGRGRHHGDGLAPWRSQSRRQACWAAREPQPQATGPRAAPTIPARTPPPPRRARSPCRCRDDCRASMSPPPTRGLPHGRIRRCRARNKQSMRRRAAGRQTAAKAGVACRQVAAAGTPAQPASRATSSVNG